MPKRSGVASDSVRAVERAVEILQSFSRAKPSMTVAEIKKVVGLSRPTLYRILNTLERKGLVKCSGEPQRYFLDFGVATIANVWLATSSPVDVASPVLTTLWEEINETVGFFVPNDLNRVCVAELPGRQELSYSRGVGHISGMHETASGRAILAFSDNEIMANVEATLAKGERGSLHRELKKIRRDGFAFSGGSIVGIRGIAAPCFAESGKVIGSISITGPESRLKEDRLPFVVSKLRAAVAEVSKALGYRGTISSKPEFERATPRGAHKAVSFTKNRLPNRLLATKSGKTDV